MAEYIERETIRKLMRKYGFRAEDMTINEFVEDVLLAADVVPVVHGKPTSREDLIAALEACAKGTCYTCPLLDAPSSTCWEMKREAAEIIRSLSEEIDTLRAELRAQTEEGNDERREN